eukprot:CAMPEP_0206284544 /NCGR_PEP_ID=MMETSP0047_2-20121206/40831_1 /ASSEMBLY_ACC=CAM_ASM_000192 /TAXON_ID=195065 /ORGANISM="Chroomonas mesostigmatica_cf, Strain CCMP1168" /LENGTH=69 /DNA_ID=CAMNT_0053715005 /DNA_START=248 /DNA_END=457 /DNA_ORIENTATION=-
MKLTASKSVTSASVTPPPPPRNEARLRLAQETVNRSQKLGYRSVDVRAEVGCAFYFGLEGNGETPHADV